MRLPALPKVELEDEGVEVVVGLGGGSGSIPSIDPQNLEQPQEMLDSTRKYWLLEIFGIDQDLIFVVESYLLLRCEVMKRMSRPN